MSLLHLVGLALLATLALVVKKVIELALEKEYEAWAPALARLLVRLAGLLCRSRRGQWWADLLYVQRVKKESGLLQAGSCLVDAPRLAVIDTAVVVPTLGRKVIKNEFIQAFGVPSLFAVSAEVVGVLAVVVVAHSIGEEPEHLMRRIATGTASWAAGRFQYLLAFDVAGSIAVLYWIAKVWVPWHRHRRAVRCGAADH